MAGLNLLYDDRQVTVFHRVDPISKFLFVVTAVVLAVAFQRGTWNLVLLLVVASIVVPLTRTSLWTYLRGMRLLVFLAIGFAFAVPAFGSVPGRVILTTPIKPVTDGALDAGLAVCFRLLVIGLTSLAFVRTTHPSDIVQALTRLGINYRYAHSLALAIVFLPLLIKELEDIRQAQRVRRLGGNQQPFRRVTTLVVHLLFASLVRGLRRAQALAVSMTTKGFGRDPQRTYARLYVASSWGRALGAASVALLVVGLAANAVVR